MQWNAGTTERLHCATPYRNLGKLTAYCDQQGILIPSVKLIERVDILDAEWVLVVEKEVVP